MRWHVSWSVPFPKDPRIRTRTHRVTAREGSVFGTQIKRQGTVTDKGRLFSLVWVVARPLWRFRRAEFPHVTVDGWFLSLESRQNLTIRLVCRTESDPDPVSMIILVRGAGFQSNVLYNEQIPSRTRKKEV